MNSNYHPAPDSDEKNNSSSSSSSASSKAPATKSTVSWASSWASYFASKLQCKGSGTLDDDLLEGLGTPQEMQEADERRRQLQQK